jgi:hypothetical protein
VCALVEAIFEKQELERQVANLEDEIKPMLNEVKTNLTTPRQIDI